MLLVCLFAAGCNDLEDYFEDGVSRHLGTQFNVALRVGWKSLTMSWTNTADPVINQIRITTTLNGESKDTLLAKDATECTLRDLVDGNYELTVCALDANGNASMETTLYGRPYTETHEIINSLSRVISKHYFVKDRLVLFFSPFDPQIVRARLNYTTTGGMEKTLDIDSVLQVDHKYYLLEDEIDTDEPVVLSRVGEIEDSGELPLTPDTLALHDNVFTTDFRNIVQARYGLTDVYPQEFIDTVTVLYYDHDVSSFEDILNFPNLKTVVLGGNRYVPNDNEEPLFSMTWGAFIYMLERYTDYSAALLDDPQRSIFALQTAQKVLGIEIVHYFTHYYASSFESTVPLPIPWDETYMNVPPTPPTVEFRDTTGWSWSCTTLNEAETPNLRYLSDLNDQRPWQPEITTSAQTYEIILDTRAQDVINGVCITQYFDMSMMDYAILPSTIKVQISNDLETWKNITHVEDNQIGKYFGEQNYLYLTEPQAARYVRFEVNSLPTSSSGNNYGIAIGEIKLF